MLPAPRFGTTMYPSFTSPYTSLRSVPQYHPGIWLVMEKADHNKLVGTLEFKAEKIHTASRVWATGRDAAVVFAEQLYALLAKLTEEGGVRATVITKASSGPETAMRTLQIIVGGKDLTMYISELTGVPDKNAEVGLDEGISPLPN